MTERGVPLSPAGARLVDAALFQVLLGMEIQKAQRLRYCLSVVSLKGEAPAPQGSPNSLAEIVARRIRSTDVAVARGPDAVALLLIDADLTALPTILRRVALDLETAPWSARVSSYPKGVVNPDQFMQQAADMLTEAGQDGGRPS